MITNQQLFGKRFRTTGFVPYMALLGLAFACWARGASAPGAASWPMFRGNPALQGVAQGSISSNLSLQWTFKTEGPVRSSAAIDNNRVYIGSNDGHLYCLDLAKGERIWAFKTEGPIESSPLLLDNKVYFGSSDAYLYALDKEKGTLAWKFETGDRILGSPNWSPGPDGKGKLVLVGSYDFKLYALESDTGKLAWAYESGNYINGAPAILDNQAMFGGCDAMVHVISISSGEQVRQIDAGAYIAGSGAAGQGRIYIGHYENAFLCIDLKEGRVVWTYKDRPFPFFSSPALTADRVVFGGRDKRLHCVARKDGKRLWTFTTRGKVDSSPVVCGDRVVVGSDDGRLYLVSLEKGTELWSYDLGESVSSSPAVADGRVVIGAEDGLVYTFGPSKAGAPPGKT